MERPWLKHYDQGVPASAHRGPGHRRRRHRRGGGRGTGDPRTVGNAGLLAFPDETAATLPNRGLYTDDVARMDEDGYFYIVDRKKDRVIIGGLKVYPREIEETLHEHSAVREAAVVGVRHRVRGEQLVAQVVLKDGAAANGREVRGELFEFCRSRLASYKVPPADSRGRLAAEVLGRQDPAPGNP